MPKIKKNVRLIIEGSYEVDSDDYPSMDESEIFKLEKDVLVDEPDLLINNMDDEKQVSVTFY